MTDRGQLYEINNQSKSYRLMYISTCFLEVLCFNHNLTAVNHDQPRSFCGHRIVQKISFHLIPISSVLVHYNPRKPRNYVLAGFLVPGGRWVGKIEIWGWEVVPHARLHHIWVPQHFLFFSKNNWKSYLYFKLQPLELVMQVMRIKFKCSCFWQAFSLVSVLSLVSSGYSWYRRDGISLRLWARKWRSNPIFWSALGSNRVVIELRGWDRGDVKPGQTFHPQVRAYILHTPLTLPVTINALSFR